MVPQARRRRAFSTEIMVLGCPERSHLVEILQPRCDFVYFSAFPKGVEILGYLGLAKGSAEMIEGSAEMIDCPGGAYTTPAVRPQVVK